MQIRLFFSPPLNSSPVKPRVLQVYPKTDGIVKFVVYMKEYRICDAKGVMKVTLDLSDSMRKIGIKCKTWWNS